MASHQSVYKRIWQPFFILFALTILEFVIAFSMEHGTARVLIFVVMTIVKAFYIVAYFMHLKFERVNLIYTIILPLAFVVYLITLMINEGGAVGSAVQEDRAPTPAVGVQHTPAGNHSSGHSGH